MSCAEIGVSRKAIPPNPEARRFRDSRTLIDGNPYRDESAGLTVARVPAATVTFAEASHPGCVVMGRC